jgi:hypothetical protein
MTHGISTHLLLKQLLVALLDSKSFEPTSATTGSNRITLMSSLILVHFEGIPGPSLIGVFVHITPVAQQTGVLLPTSFATSVPAQSPTDQPTIS